MFAAPTALMNDADAAILGEVFEGSNALDGTDSAVMLTFGTGVGGAFWDGKNVYAGAYGEHPEIGHVGVEPDGPVCYCGLRGCLESVASGTAIDGFARGLGVGGIESLGAAVEAGNGNAIDLANRTRMAITYALVTLTHTFRPSWFIIGGGVMENLHRYLAPTAVPVNASTVPGPPPRVVLASLGNRAGMFGASVAARRLLHDD
jgi:glucokinase